jgi:hypothetical protein
MSKATTTPNIVSMIGEKHEPPTEPLDPFAPENLRLSPDEEGVAPAEKLLTTVPVRKPSPQSWFRVHPDPAYRRDLTILENKCEREIFYVPASISRLVSDEAVHATLYLAVDRQGTAFFWPIKLPSRETGKDSSWAQSAREAAELATRQWMRMKADMSLGAYQLWVATAAIPDPAWPQQTMDELLRIAFKNHCINGEEHIVIQILRGLK